MFSDTGTECLLEKLWFADLGQIGYSECLGLQKRLIKRRAAGEIGDMLLLLEHNPVFTIGTSGGEDSLLVSPEKIERAGVEVHRTDRGGNITYHGPGQLVGYPIMDLKRHGKDAHLYLRNLEQAVIECLTELGIEGVRMDGFTGVWVGNDKICSIGIAIRKWVSYHGFALNVSPDFTHWSLIHPCGLVDRKVTSIERLLGHNPGIDAVKRGMIAGLASVFGVDPVQIDPTELAEGSVGGGVE